MEEIKVSENRKLIVTDSFVYLVCAKVCGDEYVSSIFKVNKSYIIYELGSIDCFVEYLKAIGEDESVDDIMVYCDGYSVTLK